MANLPEDVAKVEAAAQTAVTATESFYSKAKTWVAGNAGKVTIGAVGLGALLVWKFL